MVWVLFIVRGFSVVGVKRVRERLVRDEIDFIYFIYVIIFFLIF